MIFLIEPTLQYKDGFIEGVREFHREGRQLHYSIPHITGNFAEFLQRSEAQKGRKKIPPNHVPTTDFWLIDDEEYIGHLSLRHELNDFLLKVAGHIGYQIRPSKRRQGYGKTILRLGLQKAKEMRITRVLVTCDENNLGSKKVIEYNGGQLENVLSVEGSSVRKLRYWIDIK